MFVVLLEPEDPKEVTWSTYLRKVSAAGKSTSRHHLFYPLNAQTVCQKPRPYASLCILTIDPSYSLALLSFTPVPVVHVLSHPAYSKKNYIVLLQNTDVGHNKSSVHFHAADLCSKSQTQSLFIAKCGKY